MTRTNRWSGPGEGPAILIPNDLNRAVLERIEWLGMMDDSRIAAQGDAAALRVIAAEYAGRGMTDTAAQIRREAGIQPKPKRKRTTKKVKRVYALSDAERAYKRKYMRAYYARKKAGATTHPAHKGVKNGKHQRGNQGKARAAQERSERSPGRTVRTAERLAQRVQARKAAGHSGAD